MADAGTVAEFADHVDAHNSDASRIKEVCIDMSGAFIKGVTDNLTEAEITFDKFHVMKLIGEAVDKVRRDESQEPAGTQAQPLPLAPQREQPDRRAIGTARGAQSDQPQDSPRLSPATHVPRHLQGALARVGRDPLRQMVCLGQTLRLQPMKDVAATCCGTATASSPGSTAVSLTA